MANSVALVSRAASARSTNTYVQAVHKVHFPIWRYSKCFSFPTFRKHVPYPVTQISALTTLASSLSTTDYMGPSMLPDTSRKHPYAT